MFIIHPELKNRNCFSDFLLTGYFAGKLAIV